MKNKKSIIISIAALIIAIIVFFVTNSAIKKDLLRDICDNKIRNKEIVQIEYMKYEGEPFMSVLQELRISKNKNDDIFKFLNNLENQKVNILKGEDSTKELFYLTYKDGSNMIIYIEENMIGIDNGKLWLKNIDKDKLINSMKKENIVKKID